MCIFTLIRSPNPEVAPAALQCDPAGVCFFFFRTRVVRFCSGVFRVLVRVL